MFFTSLRRGILSNFELTMISTMTAMVLMSLMISHGFKEVGDVGNTQEAIIL